VLSEPKQANWELSVGKYWKNHTEFQGLNSDQVANKMFLDPGKWFFTYEAGRDFVGLNRAWGLTKNKCFLDLLNSRFVELVQTMDEQTTPELNYYIYRLRSWDWDNAFYIIQFLNQYFTADSKSKLADVLITKNRNFGQQTRIKLLKFLVSNHSLLSDKDLRYITILKEFGRSIKPDVLELLLTKIEGGRDNAEVKAILNKSKVFNYLKYDQTKVETDRAERIKLLRDIAHTQTILKRLPFDLVIGLDEIKELPPATRLDFLKFAFYDEMCVFCRKYYSWYTWARTLAGLNQKVADRKRRKHLDRLKIKPITPDEMKDLLFSVALQKNDEVSKWFECYTKYYNIYTGKEQLTIEKSGYGTY
jgi:hypothetical protein